MGSKSTWTCSTSTQKNGIGESDEETIDGSDDGGRRNYKAVNRMRTYRLAISATGEYTAYHGGSVAQGQAAIVTAMNRVRGIYENEVAVSFTLVDNSAVVYDDGGTDPFTNNNSNALLAENATTLNLEIGSANYDVGHNFGTGGGGLAGLGVICTASKADGQTGLGQPTGDPFYIDFVSHELGHQFGGNHTFNGSTSNCAGNNRNGSTAYEPKSGSTIQAYAGICSPQNLQANSDAYFHLVSLNEIRAHVAMGSGSTCGTLGSATNNTPVANAKCAKHRW